ncbi:hypothetical protein DNL40_08525 [Xylanimonas oleitrophica]|uniref:Polyhydroxybutyrate depolymerase n=1 Tax=Xylanimonas oleitrophica TaxID=2607479 RepID=A0A2W5YFY6_9MICO|nr:alpha/beta hydrolase-fold protein [Xylanimonas oleitrophica]PZR53531.1 hypothetical protein DNL40_08525 [Xylanimonas oleitrophica]
MTARPGVLTLATIVVLALLAACSPGPPSSAPPANGPDHAAPTGTEGAGPAGPQRTLGTTPTLPPPVAPGEDGELVTATHPDRPFAIRVPASYTPQEPAPLVLLLHGYGSQPRWVEQLGGIGSAAQQAGALVVSPAGTEDEQGLRFWDATDACCDFFGAAPGDSSYLADVVTTVGERYAVDPRNVVAVGHSNGGFMAYRLACEQADLFRAVVSVAGAMADDAGACAPSRPVSVLQVHGTADDTILYAGGTLPPEGARYPSAADSVAAWVTLDGCDPAAQQAGDPLDLDTSLAGAETQVTTWTQGCEDGSRVALWTVDGGSHSPAFGPSFGEAVLGWALVP